jgi:hypothetical protein
MLTGIRLDVKGDTVYNHRCDTSVVTGSGFFVPSTIAYDLARATVLGNDPLPIRASEQSAPMLLSRNTAGLVADFCVSEAIAPVFDRTLSLKIDAFHDSLNRLDGCYSLPSHVRRIILRWRLRRLERRML